MYYFCSVNILRHAQIIIIIFYFCIIFIFIILFYSLFYLVFDFCELVFCIVFFDFCGVEILPATVSPEGLFQKQINTQIYTK